MRFTRSLSCLGLLLALAGQQATAQDIILVSSSPPLISPYGRDQVAAQAPAAAGAAAPAAQGQGSPMPLPAPRPVQPQPNAQGDILVPTADANGGACGALGCAGMGFLGAQTPQMIGDAAWPYTRRQLFVDVFFPAIDFRTVADSLEGLPILSRGPFKIAENESPAPQDRFYVTYNYYNIRGEFPQISPTIDEIDLHRQVIGFEKTYMNGHASFGVRLPFFQTNYRSRVWGAQLDGLDAQISLNDQLSDLEDSELGDMSLVFKFAFGCCKTGKLCSFGAVVTLPTGPGIQFFDPITGLNNDIHSGLLQPFIGQFWRQGNFYVHAFESLVFPLHTGDDSILLLIDVGVGYYLYGGAPAGGGAGNCGGCSDPCGLCCAPLCNACNLCEAMVAQLVTSTGFITSIVPTLEFHLNDGLTNGGKFEYFRDPAQQAAFLVTADQNVLMSQSLNMTAGVHFGVFNSSTLTLGVTVPLTVQPYDWAGTLQFNMRF